MSEPQIFYIGEAEMAADMRQRLAKMDDAIGLLQHLRQETADLLTEMFPDMVVA